MACFSTNKIIEMNILFSSDYNYARHLGGAIYSILCHNEMEKIHFFVINNRISEANIEKIEQLIKGYENAEISFVPFDKFERQLHLNLAWPISLSSYARLFVGEMLPADVDRVLYLDCDMLVNANLSNLWNTEMGEYVLGAVQDQVSESVKLAIGLSLSDQYFNAGMLLIDLGKWREAKMGEECLQFIASHNGKVLHHDQGVLNGVLSHLWYRLPLKYNVMTIHYMMSQSGIKKFYGDEASFYDKDEMTLAKREPVILHYTPSFTTHPWEQHCKHPLQFYYNEALKMTPWKDYPLEKEKNPWYVKIINFYYRNSPLY